MKLAKTLILVAVVCLTGCFDFTENIYLKLDGSGHADIRYAVPLDLLKMPGLELPRSGIPLSKEEMEGHLKLRKGLRVTGGDYREEGNLKLIGINVEFDHVSALSENGLLYEWTTDGGERMFRIVLKRTGQAGADTVLKSIFMQNLTQHGVRINAYLPRRISFSNADRADGNTARWFIPVQWFVEKGAKERTLESRYTLQTMERVQSWFEDIW